jgi:glucose-1-phosphate thymidylyltransferase
MKGIVLAGGAGTRLYPLTKLISKQLMPIYDKPTIYYPISTLMLAGIKDIAIISTPRDLPNIKLLLGDGKKLGVNFTYIIQEKPNGIAEAFILAEEFIGKDSVCLILGDNIFHGDNLINKMQENKSIKDGACVFAYHVKDPERYGVAQFDKSSDKVISLIEKPKEYISSWAVTGLYFYDNKVCELAKTLKPSSRGELEITDLSNLYLKLGNLKIERLNQGVAWLDTGTFDTLLSASVFVQMLEERQGQKLGCLEESAYIMGYINDEKLLEIAKEYNNNYREYLTNLVYNKGY